MGRQKPGAASRPGVGRRAVGTLCLGALLAGCTAGTEPPAPNLVLITLDTTRSDALGAYGSPTAKTPTLDALASRGTLYARAITASPLTLPAHATLLTGLDPPAHGLLDNGVAALDAGIPTLATRLSERGYLSAAFVSSRVLDRRFGLDHGFDPYDDSMTAENLGEYGYPERDARSVTSAAVAWLEGLSGDKPYFLWVHYYDPHAPYEPPMPFRGANLEANYAGEISFMDSEIGRLLAALPANGGQPVIAVAGDHGESLGEHGEPGHGIFLYRAALEVPLILEGPGIPSGQKVEEVVATRRLTATLLRLLGAGEAAKGLDVPLPGLSSLGPQPPPEPVYSVTYLPSNAYGWSPLRSLTDQSHRFIAAPRPELYDFVADPGEGRNLFDERRSEARAMEGRLAKLESDLKTRRPPPSGQQPDPELLARLRSLGYLGGSSPPSDPRDLIDPKDGIALLAELRQAKRLIEAKSHREAVTILRGLVERNPGNLPFWTHLGEAELGAGNGDAALEAYRKAVELSPRLDFPHLNLAQALRSLNRPEEARKEYELALRINPRSAVAWLALAEMALREGDAAGERRLLTEAIQASASSALIRCRLGQIEAEAGNRAAADLHFQAATALAPDWALPWMLWGESGEAQGQLTEALRRYSAAAVAEPSNPSPLLRLGQLYLKAGDPDSARAYLQQAAQLAPDSAESQEARRLLRGVR